MSIDSDDTHVATSHDANMVKIPGGCFDMGSDVHYPEEKPKRKVTVEPFWMDITPVTNRQFRVFVEATGYVTLAERAPDPADFPGVAPSLLVAGSLVFTPTQGPVDLRNWRQWWAYVAGASWCHPLGPNSDLQGLDAHPVTHVVWEDALAYAQWAGLDLPTEAEWECAAWGGVRHGEFAWGDELTPGGEHMANIWQGKFPYRNTADDGWVRTSPVGSYPANAFGLYDMIGNVWEWTRDWWSQHEAAVVHTCCAPIANPQGGCQAGSKSAAEPLPRKVLKGGSYLCTPEYCRRYRPSARQPQAIDSSTSHIGFRCISRGSEKPSKRA